MNGNRSVTYNRTAQARIYALILKGESYDDLLGNIKPKYRKEIMDKIECYRTIEQRDMNAALRAKTTGLKKSTCLELNRVFEKTRCAT